MSKKPEKESMIINDRRETMGPAESIKNGMKFLLDQQWDHIHSIQHLIFKSVK